MAHRSPTPDWAFFPLLRIRTVLRAMPPGGRVCPPVRGGRRPAVMSSPVAVTERPDGRVLRGRRNREAVVDAFLSLLEEGDPQPRAGAIASRAGVSTRSVFQHFRDLESLYLVAGQREAKRLAKILPEIDPSLSRRERIEVFVARRAEALEALAPVAAAARLREPQSAQLRANRQAFVDHARRYCRETFRPELESRGERGAPCCWTRSSWPPAWTRGTVCAVIRAWASPRRRPWCTCSSTACCARCDRAVGWFAAP